MSVAVFGLVLLAATLHAVWNLAAKRVAGDLGTVWMGLCLGAVLSWPGALLAQQWQPLTWQGAWYILTTGLIHAWYFGFLARAYTTGDISVVYPVTRGTGVAGTAAVAGLWLHEIPSLPGMMGMLMICVGAVLMGWSQRQSHGRLGAYLYALLVGVTIIGYSVVDKLAVQHVHPILYISGMFSVAAVLLAPYVLWQQRGPAVLAALAWRLDSWLIGLGSLLTYLLILFAFRLGPASYIVASREFAVVIGAVLGVVVLKERLTARKGLGIATITLGLILVKMA